MHFIIGILAVFGAFGFIIFIHELGHLTIARRVGIRCPEFAIGFGKILFEFNRKGTRWALRLVPVGGYVQMVGEDPAADTIDSWHEVFGGVVGDVTYPTTPRAVLEKVQASPPPEGRRAEWELVCEHLAFQPERLYRSQEALEGNFNAMSIPQRVAVVLGGVFMNFVAAVLLMWFLGFTYGVGGFAVYQTNSIEAVLDNSVAREAGLRAGDTVDRVAGRPVESGAELMGLLGQHPGQSVEIEVLRKKQKLTMNVVPDATLDGVDMSFRGKGETTVVGRTGAAFVRETLAPQQVGQGTRLVAIDGHRVGNIANTVDTLRTELLPHLDSHDKMDLKLEFEGGHTIVLNKPAADLMPHGKLGMGLGRLSDLVFCKRSTNEIESVTAGSLAAGIGLQADDVIIDVNNVDVPNYDALAHMLGELSTSDFSNGRIITIRVGRGEELKRLILKQAPPTTPEAFGVVLAPITVQMKLELPFRWIGRLMRMPYDQFGAVLKHEKTMHDLGQETQGPLGIMQSIYEIAQHGLPAILFFLAILNAAVGAFNLIPFPALDGMRCLLLLVSAVRRRELNPEKEAVFHLVGLGVLLCVVLLVTFQDVGRLVAGTQIMK